MDTKENSWSQHMKRNTFNLGLWTSAWLITMAIATFGPLFIWKDVKGLTLSFIVLNLLVGLGMIVAYKRYLNGLDEMQKKIQLEALAIALGFAVIFGLAYSALDVTNIISYDAEISHLVILIGLTYKVSVAIGQYRYR